MKMERIYTCMFLLMFFSKMLHLPIAGFIIIVTGILMAASYMFFGFYFFSDEHIKRQNLPLSIIAGICLSIAPVAITYRLQYWPGSGTVLLAAMALSLVVFALVWFLRQSAGEELKQYYKDMFSRSLTLFVVSFLLYVIPVSSLVHIQYWDNKEFADIAGRLYSNPDDSAYLKEYNTYRSTHTPSGKLIKIIPPKDPAGQLRDTSNKK